VVYGELFIFLAVVWIAFLIIKAEIKAWRRGGVKERMVEIDDTVKTAEEIKQFQKGRPDPKKASKTVEDFTN
jgi:hypothetical protein